MRAHCPVCEFILERCLCDVLRPIPNNIKLIVLQHPHEKNHALNTVRLMTKSFVNIKVFVGENFNDEKELIEIIKKENVALLFPGGKATHLLSSISAPITHLILLDGTWKKAKKIFYSSS